MLASAMPITSEITQMMIKMNTDDVESDRHFGVVQK